MSDEDLQIACASFIVLCDALKSKKREKKRRYWMTSLFRSRTRYRASNLLNDLSIEDTGQYKNFCRMSAVDFEILINLIGPKVEKRNTNYRPSILLNERLALTLRFLATGDSYTSLMYLFKISKQSISKIVVEVCEALIEALKNNIKLPGNPEEWLQHSKQFEESWNFPHCLGAMDGKHIVLQAPIGSGSEYFNYKSFFSIVLFALVDANYNFIFANIGSQGRISDVFKNSSLWKLMEGERLNIPKPQFLPDRHKLMPYVIVADDAFALHENIMKPYAGVHAKGSLERVFNYRLSRARRIVENAFGILSAVFKVLRKPMLLSPEKASLVVLSTIHLHNFLRNSTTSRHLYTPPDFPNNVERSEEQAEAHSFLNLRNIPRKSSLNAQEIRREFAEYFLSNGRVQWQDDYA